MTGDRLANGSLPSPPRRGSSLRSVVSVLLVGIALHTTPRRAFAGDALAEKSLAAVAAMPSAGEDSSVPLPKLAADVAVAGNGRWLVLAMQGFNGLAVYDADEKRIIHTIRLPTDDFLYAAGDETLMVYAKEAGILTSFHLATGRKIKSKHFPAPGVLLRMVMGRARGDRALVRVANLTDATDRCDYAMLDTSAFAVVPLLPVAGGADYRRTSHSSGYNDPVHLRPDGMLGLVAEWGSGGSPGGLLLFRINKDTYEVKYEHSDFGAPTACDDGLIYATYNWTQGLVLDRELARKGEVPGPFLFPGIGSSFYLGMDAKGTFTVYRCGQTTPLARFGAFPARPDLNRMLGGPPLERLGYRNGFDKQVVFDPVHGRLILIPMSLDKVIQRPFNAKTALDLSGLDYLVVISWPSPIARRGKAYTYRVQVLSRAGGVTCSLESGPEGMTVSADGQMSWMPGANAAPQESVIVLVKDKDGRQCFHTFDLFVVNAAGE